MSVTNGFDPLATLLRAQRERPPGLDPVNLRVLSPFQRSLLVIDGTVTKFIEAYTMEPLDIERLSQDRRALDENHAWLEAPQGMDVLVRQVLIQGRYSRRPYVYAVSLVVPERLPESVRASLEEQGAGIGRLLDDAGLETRREILWFGREHVADLPAELRGRTPGEFVSRAYRIVAGGRPLALINEKFPCDVDPLPSHH